MPIIAGRDFSDADRREAEPVVIISESLARRMFGTRDAVNRGLMWTDPVMKFIDVKTEPRRIIGIAKDVDDENVVPGPAMSVYHPFQQEIGGGRIFVHARTDPYALVPQITRIIRDLSPEQPVESRQRWRTSGQKCWRRPSECAGVRRLRRGGADDCRRRCRGRPRVLRQCPDARVRHPPRYRIGATASADAGACARGRHRQSSALSPGVIGGPGARARRSVATVPDVASRHYPDPRRRIDPRNAAMLASLMPAARASRVDVIKALRAD